MGTRLRVVALFGALIVIAAACNWSTVGFDASRAGSSAFDRHITVDNVGPRHKAPSNARRFSNVLPGRFDVWAGVTGLRLGLPRPPITMTEVLPCSHATLRSLGRASQESVPS